MEVTTDQAPAYPGVLEDLLPAAWHRTGVIIVGHALVQNVRRGHYELAAEEPATRRLAVAFDQLAVAIRLQRGGRGFSALGRRNATAPA